MKRVGWAYLRVICSSSCSTSSKQKYCHNRGKPLATLCPIWPVPNSNPQTSLSRVERVTAWPTDKAANTHYQLVSELILRFCTALQLEVLPVLVGNKRLEIFLKLMSIVCEQKLNNASWTLRKTQARIHQSVSGSGIYLLLIWSRKFRCSEREMQIHRFRKPKIQIHLFEISVSSN